MLVYLTVREEEEEEEEEKEESQKINDLSVLATCQSGTSAMLSSEVNDPIAHGSTNFECVTWALLMWPPFFFGVIPTYGVLPYAMIVSQV